MFDKESLPFLHHVSVLLSTILIVFSTTPLYLFYYPKICQSLRVFTVYHLPFVDAAGNPVAIGFNNDVAQAYKQEVDNESKELFASFRVFCNRKNVCSNLFILIPTSRSLIPSFKIQFQHLFVFLLFIYLFNSSTDTLQRSVAGGHGYM